MPKVHLVQTKNPLSDGDSQTSMCGEVIFKAEIGGMCNMDVIPGIELDSILKGVCSKCQKAPWTHRYLYFVIEAATNEFGDVYES